MGKDGWLLLRHVNYRPKKNLIRDIWILGSSSKTASKLFAFFGRRKPVNFVSCTLAIITHFVSQKQGRFDITKWAEISQCAGLNCAHVWLSHVLLWLYYKPLNVGHSVSLPFLLWLLEREVLPVPWSGFMTFWLNLAWSFPLVHLTLLWRARPYLRGSYFTDHNLNFLFFSHIDMNYSWLLRGLGKMCRYWGPLKSLLIVEQRRRKEEINVKWPLSHETYVDSLKSWWLTPPAIFLKQWLDSCNIRYFSTKSER